MKPSKEVLEQYIEDKLTGKEIAKLHGVTRQRVHQWYQRYNLKSYHRPASTEPRYKRVELDNRRSKVPTEEILELHKQGLTPDQIRKHFEFGVSYTTILRRLYAVGLRPNRTKRRYFSKGLKWHKLHEA